MKRKLFSVLLILVLLCIGVLSGCENPDAYPGIVVPNREKANGNEDETVETTQSKGNITITGWYTNDCTKYLMAFLAEKYPEYTFEYRYLSTRNYESLVDSQLSSKLASDIVMLNPNMTRKHAANGYIEDLTRYTDGFAEKAISNFRYEDAVYAIPSTSEYQCIFYNKDIFEKSGRSMPNSYDSYLEFCDYLYDRMKIKPMSAGLKNSEKVADFALAILATGYFTTDKGSTFGERLSKGETTFREEIWAYMSKFQDLCNHKVLMKEMTIMDDKAAINEFAAGKSFMYMGNLEDYNLIMEANPDIRIGTMSFNVEMTGKAVLVGGCNCGFAVNKYSSNKEIAMEIVTTLATEEGQRALWRDRVGSQTYLENIWFDNPDVYDPLRPSIHEGHMYMPWYEWGDNSHAIYIAFGDELQKVVTGERSMNVALQVLDDKIKEMYKDN